MKLQRIVIPLLVIGVVVSSACAQKEHRAGDAQAVENTSGASETQPALWEPADKAFQGCAGG